MMNTYIDTPQKCDKCGKEFIPLYVGEEFKSLTSKLLKCPECKKVLCKDCSAWSVYYGTYICKECLSIYRYKLSLKGMGASSVMVDKNLIVSFHKEAHHG